MATPVTRFGLLGCGKVATDWCTALSYLPTEVKAVAVAARSLQSAEEFAAKFQIPKAYGSYNELVKDPEVDIVYVSVLHPWHYQMALLCLQNGKGVLCEKPITMNAAQLEHLISVARQNKVFFMEAMWTRYFPFVLKLRQLLREGAVGDVKLFQANFCLSPAPDVARLHQVELGGGALLDIGIYSMAFSQMVFNGAFPTKISTHSQLSSYGTDVLDVIVLEHGEGQRSVQTLSMLAPAENHAIISGTLGYIKVDAPFNCSEGFTLFRTGDAPQRFEFPLPQLRPGTSFNFPNGVGMVHQAKYVAKLFQGGQLESDQQSLQESLDIIKILDQLRAQMGLVYPADSEPLLK